MKLPGLCQVHARSTVLRWRGMCKDVRACPGLSPADVAHCPVSATCGVGWLYRGSTVRAQYRPSEPAQPRRFRMVARVIFVKGDAEARAVPPSVFPSNARTSGESTLPQGLRRAWATSRVRRRGRLPRRAAARSRLGALAEGARECLERRRSARIFGDDAGLEEASASERQADLLHVANGCFEGRRNRGIRG